MNVDRSRRSKGPGEHWPCVGLKRQQCIKRSQKIRQKTTIVAMEDYLVQLPGLAGASRPARNRKDIERRHHSAARDKTEGPFGTDIDP